MPFERLKAKHKQVAEQHTEPSRVRLHRAISWLGRAEKETEDWDAQFIFLWIAFNAAYAREFGIHNSERDELGRYIATVLSVDREHRLRQLMSSTFSGPVRTLIENKFVFEPFWRALRDHDGSGRWESQFAASKVAAMKSVMANDTGTVLSIVFDRLYVLRNQLVHGGATWNSKLNREQVKDGARLLTAIVPLLIELMLDHPEVEFEAILYPVV